MKNTEKKIVEWLLRVALSAGFLSAVADRFGFWPKEMSVWGNWQKFVEYTHTLMPFLSAEISQIFAILATVAEGILGILLLTPFRTSLVAKASGVLILSFAISMAAFLSIKAPLDYSVFTGMAASFALSYLTKNSKISVY